MVVRVSRPAFCGDCRQQVGAVTNKKPRTERGRGVVKLLFDSISFHAITRFTKSLDVVNRLVLSN